MMITKTETHSRKASDPFLFSPFSIPVHALEAYPYPLPFHNQAVDKQSPATCWKHLKRNWRHVRAALL